MCVQETRWKDIMGNWKETVGGYKLFFFFKSWATWEKKLCRSDLKEGRLEETLMVMLVKGTKEMKR